MKKENIARVGLRIPYELNTKLIEQAERIGVTKNALVILILRDWIKELDKHEDEKM